jgi:TRAP-type uncharacterized transport system substrate-binding protein
LAAAGVVFLVFAVLAGLIAYWLWPRAPRVHAVTMLTDVEPHRNLIAKKIQDEGRHHHLDIQLSAKNQGSLTALDEADTSDHAKLALVPGGITRGEYRRIKLVTALTQEPLQVLVRPDLVVGGLPALRGRRVNLGPTATASYHLGKSVLAFVGLQPAGELSPAGYQLDATAHDDLMKELDRIAGLSGPERTQAIAAIPDAVIFLAPLPSQLAKRLVSVAGYQLVPIPFADAFCVERLATPMTDGIQIDRAVLGTVVIPPYTYGGNPPVPAQPCSTLAAPLLVIAQADANPEMVYRVLETVFESPLKNILHPPPLSEQAAAFPWHIGSERYQKRQDPWLDPDTKAKIGSAIGGIASFVSGIIGFVTFLRVMKLRRFERHYRELSRLQLMARGFLTEPGCPNDQAARRQYLESRLTDLQRNVFHNFAVGGLRGESQLADMNAMINDMRAALAKDSFKAPADDSAMNHQASST